MNEPIPKKNSRNTTDDLIRVIAIIFVIMIHTPGKPWEGIIILDAMVTTLIFFSNSLFYMLSGKYNIGREFSTANDYAVYYKKKIIGVVFPYVLVSLLLSIWNMKIIPDPDINAGSMIVYYLKYAFKDLFSRNNSTHLWFMFGLMGYLLSAPFISKMFHAMSDIELHILFGITLIWNTVSVLVFPFFYKQFSYSGWFLSGWFIHFCMGYYVDRMRKNGRGKWMYCIGIAGIVLNVIGMTFGSNRFLCPTDLAPSFIMACAGVMFFLSAKINNLPEKPGEVVRFLAKNTFIIYMVHYNIANYVTPYITTSVPNYIRFFCDVIVTFMISLAVSIMLNLVIDPGKKLLGKVFSIPG